MTDQQRANAIARKAGYGKATEITYNLDIPEGVTGGCTCGYRKRTTGQYVPKAYLRNFGWKNTYYQPAVTVVNLHKQED